MRVLLDEQVPIGLSSLLVGHEVHTVAGMGWSGVKNGELLTKAASASFAAFVTMDRHLQHQQNLSTLPFGILLLRAPSNRLRDIEALTPALLSALPTLRPGQVTIVGG